MSILIPLMNWAGYSLSTGKSNVNPTIRNLSNFYHHHEQTENTKDRPQ